jgi:hypothetical protein
MIKGTFKDHLVTWVIDHINAAHSARDANAIIDDIDRRSVFFFLFLLDCLLIDITFSLALVPSFSGLRRFYQGRNFKQWTGDDSKALMKVLSPRSYSY